MTDADLRELERRFRETGSVEDEAAWLRARLQVGELSISRLELALLSGSKAAGVALGSDLRPRHEVLPLLAPPLTYGVLAHTRAGLAALVYGLSHWRASGIWETTLPSEIAALAESWLIDPSQDYEAALADMSEHLFLSYFSDQQTWVAYAAGWVANVILGVGDPYQDPAAGGCVPDDEHVRPVCEAIREELLPWALGYGDPVRERVEGREVARE